MISLSLTTVIKLLFFLNFVMNYLPTLVSKTILASNVIDLQTWHVQDFYRLCKTLLTVAHLADLEETVKIKKVMPD